MPTFTSRFAIAAIGAILTAAAPAQAQTAQPVVVTASTDVLTTKVSYDDLNLSSAAGRKRLDARVRAAARNVCPGDTMPLAELVRALECRQAAHADANNQIEQILAARG